LPKNTFQKDKRGIQKSSSTPAINVAKTAATSRHPSIVASLFKGGESAMTLQDIEGGRNLIKTKGSVSRLSQRYISVMCPC